ncbi:MAG: hypothetical protein U5N86_05760, partial [Planctomycetota bacterium]|nr:hypothetical protein [Planctomycetota bacterium]
MYDEAYEVALEALEQMPYDGDLTGAKHICSLVSKKAPALRGTDLLTGESFDISDMKGHIVILDFRHYLEGISCDEIKFLRDIKQKWHDTGVRIVSVTVSLEEPGIQEGIVAGFKANGMNWTSLYRERS